MNIIITTVPHYAQRYETVGDWQWQEDEEGYSLSTLHITVSQTNYKYKCLIAVHELIEALLCTEGFGGKDNGVSEAEVDGWDLTYKGLGDPGDDPRCPYHRQHRIATIIEMQLAYWLGVDWAEYEKTLAALEYSPPKPSSPAEPAYAYCPYCGIGRSSTGNFQHLSTCLKLHKT
jgi:hypothetical protein